MPNYTTNLNLEKPLGDEQYNIAVQNANMDKIDTFAGQVPARALTADKLTTGATINGTLFKGDSNITLPVATNSVAGTVKPDNNSITVDENGVITSHIENDKLHALKSYADNGELLIDSEGLADVKSYAHSTFDRSKFTVEGSPIITSDGIASGFTTSNYLKLPLIDFNSASSWEISFNYIVPSSSTYAGGILSPSTGNSINIVEENSIGKYGISFSSTGNSWDIYTTDTISIAANTNDVLKFVLSYSNNTYSYQIFNLTQNISIDKVNIPSNNKVYNQQLQIGSLRTNFAAQGSLDLKQFSITVDGVEVFSGNKTGIDTIKPDDYTVVGSPTISADGIASGFSSSNEIYIPVSNISSSSNLDIVAKVKTGISVASNGILHLRETSQIDFGLDISSQNKLTIRYWNGSSVTYKTTDYTVNANIDDLFKLNYNNGTVSVYANGVFVDSVTGVSITNPNALYIGESNLGGGTKEYFTGSVNLNAVKIYVDGDLVYQPCLKIPYTQSSGQYGSKIVNAIYRDRVLDAWEQNYPQRYYTLDEVNGNFTLPMGEVYGGILQNTLDYLQPDYANGISATLGANVTFTAPSKGVFYSTIQSGYTRTYYINSVEVVNSSASTVTLFLNKGDIVGWSSGVATGTQTFYPLKGV